MNKFNFKIALTNLIEEPMQDQDSKEIILSNLLYGILVSGNSENYIKHMIWATELTKEGTVSVDDVDKDYLLNLIKTNKNITDLIKYKLYLVFKESSKL